MDDIGAELVPLETAGGADEGIEAGIILSIDPYHFCPENTGGEIVDENYIEQAQSSRGFPHR